MPGGKRRLERFHAKLASMSFLDPACGCGNFLVLRIESSVFLN